MTKEKPKLSAVQILEVVRGLYALGATTVEIGPDGTVKATMRQTYQWWTSPPWPYWGPYWQIVSPAINLCGSSATNIGKVQDGAYSSGAEFDGVVTVVYNDTGLS